MITKRIDNITCGRRHAPAARQRPPLDLPASPRGGPGVASDGSKGENSLDAVTPGLTLGTLYSSGVGINKTKQHKLRLKPWWHGVKGPFIAQLARAYFALL